MVDDNFSPQSPGHDGLTRRSTRRNDASVSPNEVPIAQPETRAPAGKMDSAGAPRHESKPEVSRIQHRRRDARSNVRRRSAMRRRTIIIVPLLVVVIVVGLVMAGMYIKRILDAKGSDYQGSGSGEISIVVPEGATGSAIGDILAKADVVASSQAFYNACLDQESACKSIQPGTYNMAKQMSAAAALSVLIDEANRLDEQITVGPGLTKWQVRDQLVNVGGFSPEDVQAAMDEAPGLPKLANGEIEGWLAPGTYLAGPDKTAADIVKQMIGKNLERLKSSGVPESEWETFLIKASIVQREGSDLQKQDYAKIARVVENRLVDNPETVGYLNMDSTVLYGLGETKKARKIPTAAEIADSQNLYNTYKHKGLPPSPIGVIGVDAFKATVKPDEGSWLYFTTVNLKTGETRFVSTQAEQDANVQLLRDFCAQNPGICGAGS